MAQRAQKQQALRSAFDTAYRVIDSKDDIEGAVQTAFSNENARKTGLTIMSFGVIFLAIVVFFAADVFGRFMLIMNLPPAEVLLETPYEVTGLNMVIPEDGAPLITLPAQGYTYVGNQTSLPAINCLGNAMPTEQATPNCGITIPAFESEAAIMTNSDNQIAAIAVANYENQADAYNTFRELFEYSRAYGQIGNFVIARSHEAPFFFSFQNNILNFTWMSDTWIYTVSAPELNSIGEFIEALPMVEAASTLDETSSGLQTDLQ
ncbi:MAG: hypothetical protein CL607_25420 [Anaerolineaceae bacterium]|nr:hypothetical protein [Anaerolineaceae bacterium]